VQDGPSGSTGDQPLAGKRLVVTSFDLQQQEHRGIAVYSKALLRALKQSGAEIWLLTDFDPPIRDSSLKRAAWPVKQLVYEARVLHSLAKGYGGPLSPWAAVRTISENKWLSRLLGVWLGLRELGDRLKRRRSYDLDQLKKIYLHQIVDSPYQRLERLKYFDDLDGLIGARYLYLNAFREALAKPPKPVTLGLGGFDGLITTAPMNLKVNGIMVQTIHDMIPLEYVETTDHIGIFHQRMLMAKAARRVFVSRSSEQKYNRTYGEQTEHSGLCIVQPPSLEVPQGNSRRILNQDLISLPSRKKGGEKQLTPFQYVLFNSSIEPRKNLLPVIKAYQLSGLPALGIRFCITGQLKRDSYSKQVAKHADSNVILTGYVDESLKTSIFLNSLMVVSPSLVEGFGIPVMDAACLGIPVLASPSESHREIQELYDFSTYVRLCDARSPACWGEAMDSLAQREQRRISNLGNQAERDRRLARYQDFASRVFEKFRQDLCSQILREKH